LVLILTLLLLKALTLSRIESGVARIGQLNIVRNKLSQSMKLLLFITKRIASLSVRIFVILILSLFANLELQAQEPNDCEGAIVICDDGPVSYTPIGPGNPDFNTNTCGTTEHQSAWYYFEFSDIMPPNQILEFIITPNSGSDYDFAIWGPNVDCDDLDAAGMIRCNFSPIGITGLVVGGGGSAFEEALTVNPNEGYYLLVDNFSTSGTGFSIEWFGSAAPYLDCNANPNCELIADAGDVIYFCEGETFELVATVSGGNGNAIYNWKGNPPGVTQFIADTSAATTSVTIPIGFGNEFEFLLTVTEDSCTAQAIAVAVVQSPSEPTFDVETELCESDDVLVLPTTSNEGVPGTWNPTAIDPLTDPSPITAVFTPDDNVGSCIDTLAIVFTISESVEPLFNLPTEFCEADDTYNIPTTSEDGHPGVWIPGIIVPNGNAGASITATFTTSDVGCFAQTQWTFGIVAGLVPDFDFDNTICEFADPVVLDPFSIDGFSGVWSVPIIDPSGLAGFTISSTFTPDPVVGTCLLPYTHEWTVIEPAIPDFPEIGPLCALDPLLILPTQSTNNEFFGSWNPAQLDPADLGAGTYIAAFTPDVSFGDCVEDVLIEIEIFEELEISFDPLSLCELDPIFNLPTTTSAGIMGTWIPSSINPANFGGTEVIAIFTPELGLCAQPFEWTITIEAEEEITFDIPLNICELTDPVVLSSTSDNGIQGTWSNPLLDPANATGDFIVSIFSPDPTLHPCAEPAEYITFITPSFAPEFLIPEQLCELDDVLILETISLNGLRGEWTIPAIDPYNSGGNIVETTFVPEDSECTLPLTIEITIESTPFVDQLTRLNPSDCGIEDGSIIIETQQSDSEYSIDGGTTWLTSGAFDQLPGGSYTILMRLPGLSNCITDTTINLTSPGAPEINEVIIDEISDCNLQNGSLNVIAEGTMLEYSIDNGNTWQADPLFEGLDAGNYQIVVREINAPACRSVSFAMIHLPDPVVVDSMVVSNVSDCAGGDGQLSVRATGNNLEYSIDQGATWQSSPIFDHLSGGTYDVWVRNSAQPACTDMLTAEINEPAPFEIIQLTPTDLTDCQSQDGSIFIDAGIGDFEYSIDGGLSFQLNNFFDGLLPGTYEVVVRRIGATGCTNEDIVRIFAPNAPSVDSIGIIEMSNCGAADGQLNVFANGIDLEYSIDGGLFWQASSSFSGLNFGSYQILIRSSTFINCIVMQSAEIADLLPPEIVEVIVKDVDNCLLENGSITINATGASILEYSLDNSNWQSSNLFSNLGEGVYSAYVRLADHPDCKDSGNAEIRGVQAPEITNLEIEEISDCGRADGAVRVMLALGANVEYSIDGINWQDDDVFENLSPGLYTVRVRNEQSPSCSDEFVFELVDPECACGQISFIPDVIQPTCHDDETGSISINANIPDVEFDIEWDINSNIPMIENLSAGIYSFVISYFDNCTYMDNIVLINPDPIEAQSYVENSSCSDGEDGSILIKHLNNSVNYEYSIDGVTFQSNPEFPDLRSGVYPIVIRDPNNCQQLFPVTVESTEDLSPSIEGIERYIFGDTIRLMAEFDDLRVDSFYWLDQSGRVVSTVNPLQVMATEDSEFSFVAFYHVCQVQISKNIFVDDLSFYFPSAFSPNNDGINDYFLPFASNSMTSQLHYDLQIFNRWGDKVFETRMADLFDINRAWNGRRNGKLESVGPYVFTSTVYLQNGRELKFAGELQLMR
jgi:gliding motility-associated-like protein